VNRELALKVANAVLYEGYMLYPYRPSAIKNRQRWSFGILYPPEFGEVVAGTERAQTHSECLVRQTGATVLHIQLRFLHLVAREVSRKVGDNFEPVSSIVVDGQAIESWDEGVERSVECESALRDDAQQSFPFSFPPSSERKPLRDTTGAVVGQIRRRQREIAGTISIAAAKLSEQVLKLAIDISNRSALPGPAQDRDSALLGSLLSAHTILSVTGGDFVSLLDPPEDLRQAVSECRNIGNFPVLVGAEGERDMMLCSPIVLYDYPQIAPESAGDFFDGTEMDEMLTLRVMTLTDEEKDQMRSGNDHVRNLLQRTEASAREQLMRTHGTIRSMKPVNEP
jgi:hypothetical protein